MYHFDKFTSQERFERPTDALEGRCSIQLSYWDMAFFVSKLQHHWVGCVFQLKDNFNYRNDFKKSQCYFKKTLKFISFYFIGHYPAIPASLFPIRGVRCPGGKSLLFLLAEVPPLLFLR